MTREPLWPDNEDPKFRHVEPAWWARLGDIAARLSFESTVVVACMVLLSGIPAAFPGWGIALRFAVVALLFALACMRHLPVKGTNGPAGTRH